MKPENTRILDAFLSHSEEIGDDLVADTEEMLGTVPFIFPILQERPETFVLSALADYKTARPESLDARTAELIAIAAAAGAGADKCLHVHIRAALRAGATRDEILDTLQIAGLIGKTKILAVALREFREACGTKER
ncbi:alkylhydroperoxidase [Methanoculleus taiwanensis]|uniref:Alkylhydroperoxidase n=1 Tax=Methanoculleus taiwanensis TaxID=1550565 RepID=A0A498H1D3_9EURY|nr:carboxymuconolactone decarboxylase family protein [Methanoculleus taiwanensis]RXE56164.1 alkylhydroperoxidase [Methanoculleus taiwanensis]